MNVSVIGNAKNLRFLKTTGDRLKNPIFTVMRKSNFAQKILNALEPKKILQCVQEDPDRLEPFLKRTTLSWSPQPQLILRVNKNMVIRMKNVKYVCL